MSDFGVKQNVRSQTKTVETVVQELNKISEFEHIVKSQTKCQVSDKMLGTVTAALCCSRKYCIIYQTCHPN